MNFVLACLIQPNETFLTKQRPVWRGQTDGGLHIPAIRFSFVFARGDLHCYGGYLYDVGDVGIGLGAAGVVADVASGVQVHQCPLTVRNVVRRVAVFAHLTTMRDNCS